MDWLALQRRYAVPKGITARAARLLALQQVLDGSMYDVLPHPFAKERTASGEYIPLSQRRPSVRTNLCRTVVDESVSLLFGDTHWPVAMANDPVTAGTLNAFAREVGLPGLMIEAATRGSVGSVALLVEMVCDKPRLTILETAYLTPQWSSSGELGAVRERFVATGAALRASGYNGTDIEDGARYWWERVWTCEGCTVFHPHPVEREGEALWDPERSTHHGWGFVPIIWIRNLYAGGGLEPDGVCSFEKAVDTVIEADYLLSQAGRGLKYGSDPTLVLRTPDIPEGVVRQGGAASALTLPPEGDAKLLEINGAAAGAVLAHYRELRQLVLEQLHGNRMHGDRLGAPQSGRAMELMCQPLIWLADRLRSSYGELGLVPLFRMICRISFCHPHGLRVGGRVCRALDPAGIGLHWPAWFAADEQDLLPLAQGLSAAVTAGFLSRRTASRLYVTAAGVTDPDEEWTRLGADQAMQSLQDREAGKA